MFKIAIDAMGGDHGCVPIVDGTIAALKQQKFIAILVGDEEQILKRVPRRFKKYIEIIHTQDIISMNDSATDALKRKESTIYKSIELVRNGEADAVVSAGHSGATMSLATLRIGRIKGVSRPAISTMMPTVKKNGKALLLDVGANVDCKPEHLYQFAQMGKIYMGDYYKIENPSIGLLSNGEESSKGNEQTKATYKIFKEKIDSFYGNVEGSDILKGTTDVVVCDGFVGNLVLKASEGVAESISIMIRRNVRTSPLAWAGILLMRRVFKALKKQVDYAEYGGAPLLGVKKCTIICHGKSNKKAIKNSMFQALRILESNISDDIEKVLSDKN